LKKKSGTRVKSIWEKKELGGMGRQSVTTNLIEMGTRSPGLTLTILGGGLLDERGKGSGSVKLFRKKTPRKKRLEHTRRTFKRGYDSFGEGT